MELTVRVLITRLRLAQHGWLKSGADFPSAAEQVDGYLFAFSSAGIWIRKARASGSCRCGSTAARKRYSFLPCSFLEQAVVESLDDTRATDNVVVIRSWRIVFMIFMVALNLAYQMPQDFWHFNLLGWSKGVSFQGEWSFRKIRAVGFVLGLSISL